MSHSLEDLESRRAGLLESIRELEADLPDIEADMPMAGRAVRVQIQDSRATLAWVEERIRKAREAAA